MTNFSVYQYDINQKGFSVERIKLEINLQLNKLQERTKKEIEFETFLTPWQVSHSTTCESKNRTELSSETLATELNA